MLMSYILDQDPYFAFYLLSTVIVSIASALLFVKYNLIMNDVLGNFFVGIAVCPFIQYFWVMIVTMLISGASKYLYIFGLPFIATIWICYYFYDEIKLGHKLNILKKSKDYFTNTPNTDKIIALLFFVVFIFSVVDLLPYFLNTSTDINIKSPDDLEYFYKANYFANNRTLSSISYIQGIPDGSAMADNHFPSYTMYLGYAFLHTSFEPVYYPNYAAPLWAMFFKLPFLLAAASAAFCAFSKQKKFIFLLPVILFINLVFANAIFRSSRDYFRYTALFILLAYLPLLSPKHLMFKKKITIKNYIMVFLIFFISSSAHIINAVSSSLFLMAFFIWNLVYYMIFKNKDSLTFLSDYKTDVLFLQSKKKFAFRLIFMVLLGGGGILISFIGSIISFLRSGSFSVVRLDFSAYEFYADWDKYIDTYYSNQFMSMKERYIRVLDLDHNNFSVILMFAILLLLIYTIFCIFKKDKRCLWDNQKITMLLICTIVVFIPFTGLLDHEKTYIFSQYFAIVPRYGMQFFLCGLLAFLVVLSKIFEKTSKLSYLKKFGSILVLILLIGYLYTLNSQTLSLYHSSSSIKLVNNNEAFEDRFEDEFRLTKEIGDGRIFTMEQTGYVMDGKCLNYRAPIAKPIYDAKNNLEMEEAFIELGIKAVILPNNSKNSSAIYFPWYDYVTQLHKDESYTNNEVYKIYD